MLRGLIFATGFVMSLSSSLALAAGDLGSKILSEREVDMTIDLNSKTLKLSRADYMEPTVKVLIPEIADVTVMNHRNFSEGAPCLATEGTKSPQDVLQGQEGKENIKVRITLSKLLYLDDQNVCHLTLQEDVETNIRGFKFVHARQSTLPKRVAADCR